MNRRGFLGALMGMVTFSLTKNHSRQTTKIGLLHVDCLPEGTHCGQWRICDASTNKPIQFDEERIRPWHTDDGKPVRLYSIVWADDRRGMIGVHVMTYAYWRKNEGCGEVINSRRFTESKPVRIIYTGTDPRYLQFKA